MKMKKICETCSSEFERPYRLSFAQWELRRFCSKKCVTRVVRPLGENTIYRGSKRGGIRKDEHRFIMEQKLGRQLDRFELVHHINENKRDNRIENLKVVTPKEHAIEHGQWKHQKIKKCEVCGIEYEPKPTKRATSKTCSKECRYKLTSLTNRNESAPNSMYRENAYQSQVKSRKIL